MRFVYALYSSEEDRFYIGFTSDIERRANEHEAGTNHTTSRMKEPRLVYYECFENEGDARRREGYLKTSAGKKGLRLILRETISKKLACPVAPH